MVRFLQCPATGDQGRCAFENEALPWRKRIGKVQKAFYRRSRALPLGKRSSTQGERAWLPANALQPRSGDHCQQKTAFSGRSSTVSACQRRSATAERRLQLADGARRRDEGRCGLKGQFDRGESVDAVCQSSSAAVARRWQSANKGSPALEDAWHPETNEIESESGWIVRLVLGIFVQLTTSSSPPGPSRTRGGAAP